jgi:hypothetical protein
MPRFRGWSLFTLLLTVAWVSYLPLPNLSPERVYGYFFRELGDSPLMQKADAFSWNTVRRITTPLPDCVRFI